MDNLSGMLAFVRTVQAGSFVGAAERLGISASAVGKSLARLEERLGVRLLNRSTRRISLTDAGTLFFERCQRIVGEVEDAEAELARISDKPRGKLRVSLPAIGYRMLLPILPEFAERYPEIELDLDFNDRLIDVIAEGVDAVIRSGELADSQLKSRTLGPFRFVLVSAPHYFARHGVPQCPSDLERHACLRYKFPGTVQLQEWKLRLPADAPPLLLRSALTSNNLESLIHAATQAWASPSFQTSWCVTPWPTARWCRCWTTIRSTAASSRCSGPAVDICCRNCECSSLFSANAWCWADAETPL